MFTMTDGSVNHSSLPQTTYDNFTVNLFFRFDAVVSQGVDAAVEVAKYYDFIEVMPPAIYAPLIAKEQVKDIEELQTIIKTCDYLCQESSRSKKYL